MPRIPCTPNYQQAGGPFAATLVLGLTIVVGPSVAGGDTIAAQAQAESACRLLTSDEVQALAPRDQIGTGLPSSLAAADFSSCRYTWGTGTKRVTFAITLNSASRSFANMSADAIKQDLVSSIVPGTTDATIPDVGEAAVFKAYSPAYAGASAYLKDRILQVTLDGIDARDRKEQLISLLKSAASRL